MTRTATAARVTRARHVGDGLKSAGRDFAFDRAFGNEETRADKCFVAGPVVARGITVFANRRQQGITREFRAVLSARLEPWKVSFQRLPILPDDGGFGSRNIHNQLSQQGTGRNEHATSCRLKLRLRDRVPLIHLNREPHMPAADHGCRTTNKTRLVRVSYVSRVKEMIRRDFGQNRHWLLKLLAPLPFVKNSQNQLRFSVRNSRVKSTI